jgi:hypothetical protein
MSVPRGGAAVRIWNLEIAGAAVARPTCPDDAGEVGREKPLIFLHWSNLSNLSNLKAAKASHPSLCSRIYARAGKLAKMPGQVGQVGPT